MVRDAGFEPPPASLRRACIAVAKHCGHGEALRARCDLTSKAPFKIGPPEAGFKLFFARTCFGFGAASFVVFQYNRKSASGGWNFTCLVLSNAIAKIDG